MHACTTDRLIERERECRVEDIAHAIEEHFIILVYEQSEELNKENIIRSSNNNNNKSEVETYKRRA